MKPPKFVASQAFGFNGFDFDRFVLETEPTNRQERHEFDRIALYYLEQSFGKALG